MKVAIVTGANGFIGKALTKSLLSKGWFVYAVVTDEKAMEDCKNGNLKVIKAFFQDYPNIVSNITKRPDVFYHFAWQGVFGSSFNNYELQFSNAVNCGKAFELAEKVGASKFVLASTVNVLEAKKMINCEKIKSKLRATMNYSMSKLSAEMICKTLASRSKATSFNVAYIAMAYGPGNRSLMVPNVVMLKLMNNLSPDLIKGEGLYDLIYIDDIVKGFQAIGDFGMPMESYYIGHSNLETFKNIFTKVGSIVNPKVKLNFGVYPDENNIDYSLIDTTKLFKLCGFVPDSDFSRSIITTCDWLKTSGLKV